MHRRRRRRGRRRRRRRRRDERIRGWKMKGLSVRVQCRRVVLADRPH